MIGKELGVAGERLDFPPPQASVIKLAYHRW